MRILLACAITLAMAAPALSQTVAPKKEVAPKKDRETCVKLVQSDWRYHFPGGSLNRQAGPAIGRCMRGEPI